MWHISAAIIAEGKTDDRFLETLLSRTLEEVCLQEFNDMCEIGDVLAIRERPGPSSPEEMVRLAEKNGSFTDFFFHHDHGLNQSSLTDQWLAPLNALRAASDDLRVRLRSVIVIPKVEIEAWMLADVDALRSVTGIAFEAGTGGLPARPADAEGISDPKAVVHQISSLVSRNVGDYYVRLAETISLTVLRQLPAYMAVYEAIVANLRAGGVK